MKRVLLSSLILLFTTIAVFAYETIIIKYPDGELWQKAYYKKIKCNNFNRIRILFSDFFF